MDQLPDFQELSLMGIEAEEAPRIRGLRALARIIAHDILNNALNDKSNNSTMKSNLRDRLTNDKGLPRS